jgi:hypothetical protein
MDELIELIETEVKILSEKKAKDTMTVTVPFVQADEKNGNGRTYPLALLKREVSRIQGAVKRHQLIGTGDHPAGGYSDIKTASHILQKVWLDAQGKGWAEMKIIPTARGKAIQTLINHDAELGVSTRGYGNVSPTGIVQNDYKLAGIDIVMHPSYKEGTFSKEDVYESLEFSEEDNKMDKMKKMGLTESFCEGMLNDVYKIYVTEGFTGTLEDFKKEHGTVVKAAILVEEGKFETSGEATRYLDVDDEKIVELKEEEDGKTTQQTKDRMLSYYEEAVQGGFRGSFDKWKKAYPRMVSEASKVIEIVEKKEPKPKEKFTSKITWSEALRAGFRGTIEEYKKAYPNMELILPTPPQKKVVETLDEEAQRIFEGLKKDNPNSSVTLESVKKYLGVEEEKNADKRLRKRAIAIVSKDLDGTADQATIREMIEMEFQALKKEREQRTLKNWLAYKKLLD